MRSHGFEFKLDRTKRKIQRIKNQPFFLWRQRALWLGMFFDSYCSGGLRPSMGNGSAPIETPLQGKTPRWNGKSLNHCLFEIRLCTATERRKRKGHAVSAVWKLFYLLVPFPFGIMDHAKAHRRCLRIGETR